MYLTLSNVPRGRGMNGLSNSRADRVVRRRLAALGYGDGIDWSSIITAGINQAGSVAKVAVTPPLYSSVVNPVTGFSSVTGYGAGPGLGFSLSNPATASLLGSPLLLLLGFGLVLVLVLKR